MEFDGKVVLISGAAGNLGRAVAVAFTAAGASLALLDADQSGLLEAYPGEDAKRLRVHCDLLRADSVGQAVRSVLDRFDRVDVLCNIAGGFTMGHAVHETPPDEWRFMMDLNAGSVIALAREVVPRMLEARSGAIVNIGALAGLSGKANMAAYCASKSAVLRLTEAMALELRERGIRVNCVLPGTLDTPQNRAAMPQANPDLWVEPSAVAEAVLFLASERARAIQGAAIPVVGPG